MGGISNSGSVLARERLSVCAHLALVTAHALNNVLFVASGNLRLLLEDPRLDADLRELAEDACTILTTGEGSVSSLSAAGRLEEFQAIRVDVAQVLRGWVAREPAKRLERIALNVSLPPYPVLACVDPGYLECVLAALLSDASHGPGGASNIVVALSAEPLSAAPRSGSLARLSFRHDRRYDAARAGTGDPAGRVRFDPGGAGIGTWIAREFALACGGDARVDTGLGDRGMTVTIDLPLLDERTCSVSV